VVRWNAGPADGALTPFKRRGGVEGPVMLAFRTAPLIFTRAIFRGSNTGLTPTIPINRVDEW
jgi:hypothetical protein